VDATSIVFDGERLKSTTNRHQNRHQRDCRHRAP